MVTPIIMLTLLILPFLLWLFGAKQVGAKLISASTAGSVGICAVLCFTGVGHFIATESMIEMMPEFVPFRWSVVILSGLLEISIGIAILPNQFRSTVGWTIIFFLVVVLPLNVYAAINETGPGGHQWGPVYLLIRIPLQLTLIFWTWWFAICSIK